MHQAVRRPRWGLAHQPACDNCEGGMLADEDRKHHRQDHGLEEPHCAEPDDGERTINAFGMKLPRSLERTPYSGGP